MNKLAMPSTKLADWPDRDRLLWLASRKAAGPFDDGGIAAKWSSATIQGCEKGYGVWLAWLQVSSSLDLAAEPCLRVSRERIKHFIEEYSPGRAPLTIAGTVRDIGMVLRASSPPDGVAWLTKLGHRMVNTAVPIRPKLPRMASLPAVFNLANELMAAGLEALEKGKVSGAVTFRDGLLIAFLAYRPMRLRNLALLRLGDNFLVEGDQLRLDIPARATKKGVSTANAVPDKLVEPFQQYLARVRPVLGRNSTTDPGWLWLGRRGKPLTDQGIWSRVSKLCQKHLGKNMTPHLFRDCAATQIAISAPAMIGITKDILGHATLASSQNSYNQANSFAATEAYGEIIRRLLEDDK